MIPVEALAVRVTEVLSRAESLFAAPADRDAGVAPDRISDALEAGRAIRSRAAELSGTAADAHREAVAAAGDRLQQTSATEAELAQKVQRASEIQDRGRSEVAQLRASAAEVPEALGTALHTPAGELATLAALRRRVERMQHLVADHSAESARLAGELRRLRYGQ
ncbi:hypothetical protein [Mycobacterium sp.]|jgi:hypothetical protein|uniref:hypothetical protein n=1 Tax=Mycobacterium sp. TaxID=1785 RepID=UPI002D3546D0|nr:hypothetical protein [Mycobacterium sp.]HZA08992.1 hypothetical protein [Mycobacterium sp.]